MIDWYRSLTVVVVVGMFDFHSCSVPAAGSLVLSPRCRRLDMDDGYHSRGNDKTNTAVATRRKVTATTTTTTATAGTIGAVSTKAKTTTTTIII